MSRTVGVLALLSLLAPLALADADLHTVVNFPPVTYEVPVPAGSESSIAFTVFNNGPDVARDVTATIDLPPCVAARFFGDAQCGEAGSSRVVCRIGDVPFPSERAPRISVTMVFPASSGKHVVRMTADGATRDPNSSNNRITAAYVTSLAADLHVRSEPPYVRADPAEDVVLQVSVDNFLHTVDPDEVRLRFQAVDGRIVGIEPPDRTWSCSGSDTQRQCVARKLNDDCRCSGVFNVRFRPSGDRSGGRSRLDVTATSNLPDQYDGNNTASTTIERYRWITVTNTNDTGSGSLRAAIGQANGCGLTPCKIAFEIPGAVPAGGWFTIQPSTPLPAITGARVFVDGSTQTKFSGDTNPNGPEVAIDGRFTNSGHGLAIGSHCEGQIAHLAVGNFREHGIVAVAGVPCLSTNVEPRRIAHNHIGVDPGGGTAWPNLRGVEAVSPSAPIEIRENVIRHNTRSGVIATQGWVFVRKNEIRANGASGVYLGPQVKVAEVLENTIAGNAEMGVAIARGADQVEVRQNGMRDNGGLGIDWELDGVSPQRNDEGNEPSNAPVLLSARYDAVRHRTVVTMKLETRRFGPYEGGAVIDVYANDEPDGDGEQPAMGGVYARNTKGEAFELELEGDYRGKWLNATSTRVYFLFSVPPDDRVASQGYAGGNTRTSELSNSIQVTE